MPRDGPKRQQWLLDQCLRFKTAYTVCMGPLTTSVILCHPDNVKKLLKTSEPKQSEGGFSAYSLLMDWLGNII